MAKKYKMVNDKLVELTEAEEKARKVDEDNFAKLVAERKKQEEQTKKNKESAITKLKNLGLTDDEITALIGG
tara:strand:- start:323 stop:538 length:216 start_codon:yes stop_codon:yes gene_type:complete